MSTAGQATDPTVPDVLVKQWDRLSQDIRATYVLVEKLITIGLALAGLALAFKPQDPERQYLLYVLLPIPAYGIFCYGVLLFRGVMAGAPPICRRRDQSNRREALPDGAAAHRKNAPPHVGADGSFDHLRRRAISLEPE
jgi:hypothetical protein